jgi:hypothetical protein
MLYDRRFNHSIFHILISETLATSGCMAETPGTLWMRSLNIVTLEWAKNELKVHYYNCNAFINTYMYITKAIPLQPYGTHRLLGGYGSQIPCHRHLKMVGFQPYTGRLYPRSILALIFKRLSRPRAHGIVGCLWKNPQWHHRDSTPGPSDL